MSLLTNEKKKYLRQIGHDLKPVVTVAGKGLSESVCAELNRALNDHELIKIKLRVEDNAETATAIGEACNADIVNRIGNVLLLHRAAKKPNPKLSNLIGK